MTKKIIKFIILIIALFVIAVASYLLIQYKPFIEERLAFDVKYENGETHIVNNNFDISFDIKGRCKLGSEPINYISFRGIWLGNIICGNDKINIYVLNYDEELWSRRAKDNEYNGDKNILINQYLYTGFLTAVNNEKTKMFVLSTKRGETDIFNSIVESLK